MVFTNAEFVEWAYGLFGETPDECDLARKIFVTEFAGAYGPSGHIMAVEGTPTRVTVVMQWSSDQMFAIRGGRIRVGEPFSATHTKCVRYFQAAEWLRKFMPHLTGMLRGHGIMD